MAFAGQILPPPSLSGSLKSYGQKLRGWTGSIAHKSDIGGLVPGSNSGQAREIFHEGLLVPPVRFYARARPSQAT